jgi:hypothetical protein
MTAVLDKACRPVNRDGDLLRGIDRDPLRIGVGIGAPIAHGLLESVWRKSLSLMRDGMATTAEMEVVIRMGLCLRWSWSHRTGGKTGCWRCPPGAVVAANLAPVLAGLARLALPPGVGLAAGDPLS